MIMAELQKYLRQRGLQGSWRLEGIEKGSFHGAVVIPALAETAHIFKTLRSLAQNPMETLAQFLVVVVVNNRFDAPQEDRADNLELLEALRKGKTSVEIPNLAWADAASCGFELPAKGGGVGMARKIGFDLALSRLDFEKARPLLVSLDADTLVRPDYLPALIRHFGQAKLPGAVLSFCHQPASTPEEEAAICRYELFLRTYVLGLSRAGSPYAFHTIGSAMACTAEGYIRLGGMNTRMAAEDFYFLQQMARVGGVAQVKGTVVYPSARPSHRVPFGTGRSISRLLGKEKDAVLFYRKECFQLLREWLSLVAQSLSASGEEVRSLAEKISPHLGEYLELIQFGQAWEKLRKNFRSPPALKAAFYGWFDGLRTMKLIHHLSAAAYPKGEPEDLMGEFLAWAGLTAQSDLKEQLSLLRQIQIAEEYRPSLNPEQ